MQSVSGNDTFPLAGTVRPNLEIDMTRQLATYSDRLETAPKTLQKLIREDLRIVGFSIEEDGCFIYTDSSEWCERYTGDCGTFRENSVTAAIRAYKDGVSAQPGWVACRFDAEVQKEIAHKLRIISEEPDMLASYAEVTECQLVKAGSLFEQALRDLEATRQLIPVRIEVARVIRSELENSLEIAKDNEHDKEWAAFGRKVKKAIADLSDAIERPEQFA